MSYLRIKHCIGVKKRAKSCCRNDALGESKLNPKCVSIRIATLYLVMGFFWILFSDKFLDRFIIKKETLTLVNIFKGWFYVITTGIMLYFLILHTLNKVKESEEKLQISYSELSETFKELGATHEQLTVYEQELNRQFEELQTNQKALIESEERFKATFEQAAVGICHTAFDGSYIRVNQKFCDIVGYTRSELLTKTFMEITYKVDLEKNVDYLTKLINGEINSYSMEKRYIRKDGSIIWINLTVSLLNEPISKKSYAISVIEDISERKKVEEELIYLSYHDKLTDLYNRRFYEEAVRWLDNESNLPISIIVGDVNGLKLVNDAFGHDKGDELLQKAANVMRNACRKNDIVARWGGDEFVILMPKTTTEEVVNVIRKIKELYLNEHVNALKVSISFGWDIKNDISQDISGTLKSAEDHMYKNKIFENQGVGNNVISTIINTLHEKNPREEQHSKRVSEICQRIGTTMGLPEIEVSRLKTVGLLHDIGKIAIAEEILNKQGTLSELERNEINRHPDIGYRILSTSQRMLDLAEFILLHHERWDGSGYPKGLKGEEIPIVARIISLADSYDAMTSERPYRKALSEEAVIKEIRMNAGSQFDPEIARIFVEEVLGGDWVQNFLDTNK